jgi:UDP-N-acetylmuramoyl-tripeptide--D-alanyl-D-alanine ligase
MHAEITDLAAELGIDLVAVDEPRYGVHAHHVAGVEEAADHVDLHAGPGCGVLVKGSRSAGLERVVDLLLG